ncbi:MAG: helicase-related protein [Chloroflexota bacterium]
MPVGEQRLYRLRSLEGALGGAEMELLHPFEAIEPIRREFDPRRAAPLRNWLVYHQAFLLEQSLGPSALLSAQPGRMRLLPYQLVPVLRALRMGRVRLMLADGVGLGKTIQAGLIICELMARRLAHRVLIVSPAGPLLEQWRTEFRDRFGIRLEVIDRAKLEDIRRSTELGANPFDHVALGLASIDFLKQEKVLEQLERAAYDVVVIDEAHHCTDPGAGADREDSQRRRLAQVLARRADGLILATATPHDGHDRSFASLCELLDPSLVDGRGSLRGERYRPHVVRRLRSHVRDPKTGEPLWPERKVIPVRVEVDQEREKSFAALHKGVLELVKPELERALRRQQYSDALAYIALLKRSVSTAAACQATLDAVAARLEGILQEKVEDQETRRERLKALRDLHRRLARFGSVSHEEEGERELLEAEELAQSLAALERESRQQSREVGRTTNVVAALRDLGKLAERAGNEDPKLRQLVAEIRAIRRAEPHANVLVYTEYVDSQTVAVDTLKSADLGEILTLQGRDPDQVRDRVTERFREADGLILVSTDASAEGLNLHQRCHHLIHLELPFNPNRLEQRNGRIDRFGQKQEPIVRYLYLQGTFEERILLRLIAKYERQRARLTFVPNTLGVTAGNDVTSERLLQGLLAEDQRLFQRQSDVLFDLYNPEEERNSDPAIKELLDEIERSFRGFEQAAKTYAWLGDDGLNVDPNLVEEADQARGHGLSQVGVSLVSFVKDAVLLNGGDARQQDLDVDVLTLPPAWCHGMDDLPGFEPSARRFRLTLSLERTHDVEKRPIGYLGRAHPMVRLALERVRRLSLGGEAGMQDVRVSAVAATVDRPELLVVFVGRIPSSRGRALEQVIAVRITEDAEYRVYASPAEWLPMADPDRALKVSGVWDRCYQEWGEAAQELAAGAAVKAFAPVADRFRQEAETRTQQELERLEEWLSQRCREVTGELVQELTQVSLFAELSSGSIGGITPSWGSLPHGADRLAAFHADRTQPIARRSEAEGVLRLYQQRTLDAEASGRLGTPEVVPVGLLMLIPDNTSGPDGR